MTQSWTGSFTKSFRRFARLAPHQPLGATLEWSGSSAVENVTVLDISEGGCSVARDLEPGVAGARSLYARLRFLASGEDGGAPAVLTVKLRSDLDSRLGFEFVDANDAALRGLRERAIAVSAPARRGLAPLRWLRTFASAI